jgi:DNA mismatch repair protein MutS
MAHRFGYNKPIISQDTLDNDASDISDSDTSVVSTNSEANSTHNSMIKVKGIRHPIIERILQDAPYVTNDLELGTDQQKGMLLYGVNACGKSSLMKAIGLNIILAQAGFFVAASEWKYRPYRRLFTRISNQDNLFKGQSTFAVEMSELRSILTRCDHNSLILGDELCSGTESISALSIVASGVITLSQCHASFIFATHLHALSKMERIQRLHNVHNYHLEVSYDPITHELIYNRKIKKGSGDSIYGLEVCKAMDLNNQFLELANQIRLEISDQAPDILTPQSSRYNPNVFVHNCQVCGNTGEEVHHIQHQCTANMHHMIGHIHKNKKSNLVVLCKQCHLDVHHDKLEIRGYVQTTQGIQLDWSRENRGATSNVKSVESEPR